MRKLLSLLLVSMMLISLCVPTLAFSEGEKRVIRIGTWWSPYYTSEHTDIHDDPNLSDEDVAQTRLDNLRAIEEKYNCEIYYENLTWEGTIESINTSIMAGTPDCDIYVADLQFGLPAVLNGYAQALEDFLPADSDVLGEQKIMEHLNVLGMDKNYLFAEVSSAVKGFPLAFNMTMIEEAGLENPQDVYDKGEWTWDKFAEYLIALTKDIDNDNVVDVYGYGGWWTNMLSQMLMANNAGIANSKTEELSSFKTIEVLEFINKMYNVDKTARPWDTSDWNINTKVYADGKIAFWPAAAWVLSENGNSDLPFEIGVVPWPYGPSGTKESSQRYNTSGNWMFIPVGVENPELVYNILFDYLNWYQGDTSLRDNTEWEENMFMTERNYEMAKESSQTGSFDIWGTLGGGFSLVTLMDGTETPSQLAEAWKLIIQGELDAYFGGN